MWENSQFFPMWENSQFFSIENSQFFLNITMDDELRRLENLQQQKDELEQQMVSWQSIYVIINIGILKGEKFKSDFYFHVCFKSKFSFITH